jgi:hypothetical protein
MLWRGEMFDPLFIRAGYSYLLDNVIWLLIATPILAAILGLIMRRFWARVSRLLDRHNAYILAFCVIGLLVDAGVLRNTQRVQYQLVMALKDLEMALVDLAIYSVDGALPPSRIETPVDFRYLDRKRAAALYSEAEPLLAEREHAVSLEDRKGARAGLGQAPIDLKTETSIAVTESSSYKRIELSPERKCLEVVNDLLKRPSPPYYTTAKAVGAHMIARQLKDNLAPLQREVRARRSLFTVQLDPSLKSKMLELKTQAFNINKNDDLNPSVEAELRTITGLVIVEGVFRKTPLADKNANFDEQFATGTHPVWFRFNLRDRAALSLIRDGARLRVLGNVLRQWDGGQYLELHAIAVF